MDDGTVKEKVLLFIQLQTMEKGMAAPPVFEPGEFQGQRSLAGYSPWVVELDTTKQLTA